MDLDAPLSEEARHLGHIAARRRQLSQQPFARLVLRRREDARRRDGRCLIRRDMEAARFVQKV
jgi:hypothetical protein